MESSRRQEASKQPRFAYRQCPGCAYDFLTGEGTKSCGWYDCPYLPEELKVFCPACNYNFATGEGVACCGDRRAACGHWRATRTPRTPAGSRPSKPDQLGHVRRGRWLGSVSLPQRARGGWACAPGAQASRTRSDVPRAWSPRRCRSSGRPDLAHADAPGKAPGRTGDPKVVPWLGGAHELDLAEPLDPATQVRQALPGAQSAAGSTRRPSSSTLRTTAPTGSRSGPSRTGHATSTAADVGQRLAGTLDLLPSERTHLVAEIVPRRSAPCAADRARVLLPPVRQQPRSAA